MNPQVYRLFTLAYVVAGVGTFVSLGAMGIAWLFSPPLLINQLAVPAYLAWRNYTCWKKGEDFLPKALLERDHRLLKICSVAIWLIVAGYAVSLGIRLLAGIPDVLGASGAIVMIAGVVASIASPLAMPVVFAVEVMTWYELGVERGRSGQSPDAA